MGYARTWFGESFSCNGTHSSFCPELDSLRTKVRIDQLSMSLASILGTP
jgi:hypothetical protein